MTRKTLFLSVVALLLVGFVVAITLYQDNDNPLRGQDQDVYERQGAPVKGPADAKVTIVEFFDPACGTCADFYPLVKQLMDQYPGKVRVMMRYAPLHQGSDQVVSMLEAAQQQGKFWQALEILFKNQRRWVISHVSQPMRARGILNGVAMDHEKLNADMHQPEIAAAIQKDIQDGQALKVQATPEFFVNGRPMPSFGYSQLQGLVKDAVEDAY